MKGKFLNRRRISIIICVLVIFGGLCYFSTQCSADEENKKSNLNVALYGYVPDLERFKNALEEKWKKVEPQVDLNFVSWDCYESDPPQNLDVFVFDAIYLSHFVEKEYLTPLDPNVIENRSDILPFALDGCTVNGKIYAIPQIVCTNLLYTRAGDNTLDHVSTVPELYQAIGARQSTGLIPEADEGLLIDMSGGTSKVCMFLDALIDRNQNYTDYATLPELPDLNTDALNSLVLLQRMAGVEQANYWPDNSDAYIRAKWFEEGHGKAYLGYTEAMSKMEGFADQVNFKTLSLSENSNIPLFYGDVVGINKAVSEKEKQETAIKLVNVMTSCRTMKASLLPDKKNSYPQYLLPARKSVYNSMKTKYPIYGKLQDIATDAKNKLFRVGANIREWMLQAKPLVKKYLEEHVN
ncbi:thiamine pyridinylase [Anaerosacchariphilus polymeriproducens]|uniref:Thiamine pyridinylase n=1 Tax=Anaerosacchariphilus polymeriproducens TaxID=1812858 RepID=A0A371ARP9_9FIRM|nr:thiamine pyridinylase [Anaerosacchariphilus polymeriproducens]RDU22245.1 thiamine pyridinylase [Anaerosacchariphilus polymeriproducens]